MTATALHIAGTSGIRRNTIPSLGFVATAVILALVGLISGSTGVGLFGLVFISTASIPAIAIGIMWHRPIKPKPWWFVCGAAFTLTAGGMLTGVLVNDDQPVLPLIPHLIIFSAYPMLAAAATTWLRTYAPDSAKTVAIDSILVGFGALLVVWVLLMSPAANEHRAITHVRYMTGVDLVVDAVLLAVVTHVAYTSAKGNRSFTFIYGAVIAMLVATIAIAYQATSSYAGFSPWFAAVQTITHGFLGAAALHPTMTAVGTHKSTVPDRPRQRFVEVALVCILAAAIPVFRPPYGVWDQVVRALVLVALLAGVLLRSERAVRTIAVKESDARHRATHDDLTGLPNRGWLYTSYEASVLAGNGRPLSLLFMDLDDFKLVNDSYGHRTGDELIVAAAERLTAVVGTSGIVHRQGGDEFVITTPLGPAQTDSLARTILAAFDRPFVLSRVRVTLTTSIGIARASPDGSSDLDDLIREADSAMYHAKSLGSGSFAVFDDQLRASAIQKLQVTGALRSALDNDEFRLHYQPIVNVATGNTAAFEALIRWQHGGKIHNPDYFLDIAEASDIMIDIGRWVLDAACAELVQHWSNSDARPSVSVNVSARQLRDVNFVDVVRSTLVVHKLPPSALWLELTETALIDDHDIALRILDELSACGIRILLDDFGIGYSALSNLNKYPIDIVKIDKSFIAAIDVDKPQGTKERVMVNSIEAMSRALGLATVAEGVETCGHQKAIRAVGCRYAQGWHYGYPEPAMADPPLQTMRPADPFVSEPQPAMHGYEP